MSYFDYIILLIACQAKIKKRKKVIILNDNLENLIHEEKLKYYKIWRANNKDKVKKHNRNFWLKKLKEGEKSGK